MAHGHSSSCLRFTLFFFNFLVWVVGLSVFGLGIYALAKDGNLETYTEIVDSNNKAFGYGLVGLGLFCAFVGFLGCCGAVREHRGMLIVYALILLCVFIVQLVIGGLGYHYRQKLKSVVEKGMRESLAKFMAPNSGSLTKAWNKVQTKLHCCGATNYTDWQDNKTYWYTKHANLSQDVYPASCCAAKTSFNSTLLEADDVDTHNETAPTSPTMRSCTKPYKTACYRKVYNDLRAHWGIIAGTVVGVAFIQLLAIISSCLLQKDIHRNEYTYV